MIYLHLSYIHHKSQISRMTTKPCWSVHMALIPPRQWWKRPRRWRKGTGPWPRVTFWRHDMKPYTKYRAFVVSGLSFCAPRLSLFFFQVSGWRGWVCLDVFDNFFQIIHGLEWLWRLDHPWKAMEADNHIRLWHVTGRLWLKTGNRLDVCTPYNCMSFVRFVRFHYTCDTCSSQKVFICVLPSS